MQNNAPITRLEVERFPAETPGTKTFLHCNSAGSSFPPNLVVESVNAYFLAESLRGGYRYEAEQKQYWVQFYVRAASLLHVDLKEVDRFCEWLAGIIS
ncbi:MAG TPA: hypothetical protein ENJ82_02965 [Bacteroidetes bacterium]|nr:hypothetical protein [Bacteroidota bacterium]